MPILTPRAACVAQILVEQMGAAEGLGATTSDIVAGYRAAAERIAAWEQHRSWPSLRDGLCGTFPSIAALGDLPCR